MIFKTAGIDDHILDSQVHYGLQCGDKTNFIIFLNLNATSNQFPSSTI